MHTDIIIHADGFTNEREFIDHEVTKNLSGKLDAYIKKYEKPDAKSRLELTLTRTKNGEFSGKTSLIVDGTSFRSERENYKKLDDLISHLFTHLKEQLAK
ncbi:hypothetical protein KBB25_00240 [Candidatus Gracilibacteria bacterium]|nr:hypothetical protein [Candidatus Gracilibacteria bacterium]